MENGVRDLSIEERIRRALSLDRVRKADDVESLIRELSCEVNNEIARVKEQAYNEARALRQELEEKDNIIKGLAGYIGMIK